MASASFPTGATFAVIGTGVVGVATAFALAQRGYKVTVFDPFPPGMGGPSHRNAGHIAASDAQPLSTPGMALTGLKLLFKKDGPLKIPGAEKIRMIPWFLQFLSTSRGEKFQNACNAITFLCRHAIPEMEVMLAEAGMAQKMTKNGAGFIYDSAASFDSSQATWAQKAAAGFGSEAMERGDIARRLPEMNPKFAYGMLSLNFAEVTDPLEIVQGLAEAAKSRGVSFDSTKVTKLSSLQIGVGIITAEGERNFDGVVVTAGVRSKPFADALGEKLPLAAERGYNLTFPDPGFELKLPLIMPDRGLAITQLTEGLRIGGWAEYATTPDRPENNSYYKAMARISAEIFPGLNQSGAIPWMGNRPSLPDSAPVISKSLVSDRVFYNCGHGHYGLSHAAISANILGGLIDGFEIPKAHRAYAINRFN